METKQNEREKKQTKTKIDNKNANEFCFLFKKKKLLLPVTYVHKGYYCLFDVHNMLRCVFFFT